jgi:hypothetical protein
LAVEEPDHRRPLRAASGHAAAAPPRCDEVVVASFDHRIGDG